ncbi:MAG: SDR family oxidoreductase [Longimicrobiales bacterium]|nr:SDR family oxidoreductase [Longimicrobiales bacterium]
MSGPAAAGTGPAAGPAAGSVVVITGAAGGIGSALAWRWTREGARLGLLDVDEARLAELADALARVGHCALALACDVTDEQACKAAVAAVVARFGGVDVLVANAGRTHLSSFADTDTAVFRRIMDVNFFGALHITKAALPSLRARRGRIAVLSSVAGFAPLAGRSGYAASKHALHGLFESLRGELDDAGVSVTMVCPSFVRTAIDERALGGDGGPATEPRTEVGTPLDPDRVADAVVRAVRERRRLLVLSPVGKLAWWLSRVAPWAYEAIMLRRMARQQAKARPRR